MGAREPLKYSVCGGDVCTETLAQVRKATEEGVGDSNKNVLEDAIGVRSGSEGEGDSGDLGSTLNDAERGDGYHKGVFVRETPVQVEATAVILEKLREAGTRASVEFALGTGKTRLGARVVEALVRDKTGIIYIVVLVPTLALIPQTIDEWHTLVYERPGLPECMLECEVATVCSLQKLSQKELLDVCGDEYENEEEVKDRLMDKLKEKEWPNEWQEVVDNLETMVKWIERGRGDMSSKPLVRLTVSTYHSSSVVSEAFYKCGKEPALTIFDEARVTCDDDSGVNVALALKDWEEQGADLVGMTSERRLFMTETWDTSMDKENLYGKSVYRLPREKAIELGLIDQSMSHGEHSSQHEPWHESYSDELDESGNDDKDLGLDLFQSSSSESSDDEEEHVISEPPDLESRRRARYARVTRLQERAARRLCRWFTEEPETWKRATLVLPCGAGKTRAPLPLLRDLFSKSPQTRDVRILVLAPGLQLLAQILAEWRKHWKVTKLPDLDILTVCSDSKVHAKSEDRNDFEDNELDEEEEEDLKVTSDPRDVENHLLEHTTSCVRVVLSTYQSSSIVQDACKRLHELQKDSQGTFDIAIFDEAHRTVSSTKAKWASCYQIALHDYCNNKPDGINIRRRLFLTATPRCPKLRGGSKDKNQEKNFQVSTMDDEKIYGPHWVLKEKDAILDDENGKLGIVLPKKLIVGVVRKNACEEKLEELMQQCQGDVKRAEKLLKIASIDRAADDIAQEQGGVSALSFHYKVKEAESFGKEFAGYFPASKGREPRWSVNHASAKTKIGERIKMLDAMADNREKNTNARGLVTNVRALGEGVNSPSINLVVLDVNMRSAVSLGQATGRAARIEDKNPDKTFGYVLVLVMLADADVEELESTASQEREAWKSPDIKECVSDVESSEARNEPREKSSIGKKKHEREPHIQRLMASGWMFKNTPRRGISSMPTSAQKLWRSKIMPTLQEAVDLQDTIDKKHTDEGQGELEQPEDAVKTLDFANSEETNDTSARGTPTTGPRGAVEEDVGMSNQSQMPAADEPANLQDNIEKSRVDGEQDEPEQLQEDVEKLQVDSPGDSNAAPTAVSTAINGSSGDIVPGRDGQRRAVGSNLSTTFDNVKVVLRALAEANPDIQEALGEVRSNTSGGLINARDKLAKYVDVRDVTPVDPVLDGQNDTGSPNEGGNVRPKLGIEEVKNLVRLHIERVCTTTWDTMYGLLLRWRDDPKGGNGKHCNVPTKTPPYRGESLDHWLTTQRSLRKKGELAPDRLKKLQELVDKRQLFWNFDEERSNKWNQMFELLEEWGKDPLGGNGEHYNVPKEAPRGIYKGERLGEWLSRQRKAKSGNTLKGDRLSKLQELVDEGKLYWKQDHGAGWNQMFKLLEEWGKDPLGGNGEHYKVPRSPEYKGKPLGSWLCTQRELKKNGKLALDRLKKLQELVDKRQLLWDFDEERSNKWNQMFKLLKEWGKDPDGGNGEHCNVPQRKCYKHKRLGGWLNHQRQKKKSSTLTAERLTKLQELVDEGKLSWEPSEELPVEALGNFGNFGRPRKPN